MDLVMKAGFAIVSNGDFVKKQKIWLSTCVDRKIWFQKLGVSQKQIANQWLYKGNALGG